LPVTRTPGVYRADLAPPPRTSLRTGVPAFLGLATAGEPEEPQPLKLPNEFGARFGAVPERGMLAAAVEGFFANGGEQCFVVRLADRADPVAALERGLETIVDLDEIDLVCAPDANRRLLAAESTSEPAYRARARASQQAVIAHCDRVGTRIAILDCLPNADANAVREQRRSLGYSANATLYHPWILTRPTATGPAAFVPPCGHVAGLYARTDRTGGVHKAPANAVVSGALDLEADVTDDVQAMLNPEGVNCLRAFAGRGIRVWGARTLSDQPVWTYVSVRRLLLTTARRMSVILTPLLFEPQGEILWRRIRRETAALLTDLHRQGALRGASPAEAFFVRCDAETNAGAEQGQVVVHLGLAAAALNEFIVVQIVQEAGDVTVSGPNHPT
jgi:uncharacterized protein